MNRPELLLIIIGALASIFNGSFEVATWILLGEIVGVSSFIQDKLSMNLA